jgi:4-diphosphocytidyl-2-C-methyl-D-erythritol kinase
VNPGFPVSTKEVYQSLNLGLTKNNINYSIPRFSSVKDVASGLANDLERVTLRLHPALERIRAFLLKNGALGAAMTGSGPTMFGIFSDQASARRAEAISSRQGGWRTFCVCSC